MNTIFDFKRAGLLVQRHFIEKFNGELMFWGVSIICMMFIRNILPAVITFAIVGCVFRTGLFFREIHSATNRINYFMIPATQIEKFVVSLLFIVVYFWVMMVGVYAIGNVLGTWANNLLANNDFMHNLFNINHHKLTWTLFDYIRDETLLESSEKAFFAYSVLILIFQSAFLLGGIYFKKNQIFKTALVLVFLIVFFPILLALEMKYLIIEHPIQYVVGVVEPVDMHPIPQLKFFTYIMLPYLWLTSYIRLTEKEI